MLKENGIKMVDYLKLNQKEVNEMEYKKLAKYTAGIFFSIFLFCTTGWAALLDQSQTLSNGGVAFWSDKATIQTFTPSMTGWLETLSLPLGASGSAGATGFIEPIHIAITEWDGSSPQTLIGQIDTTLTVNGAEGWMNFDFLSQDVLLSAETMYAILLTNDLLYSSPSDPYRNTGIDVQWDSNPYDRGGLWNFHEGQWISWPYGDPNTDAAFETWMKPVPVPATILLFGSGLAGLAGLRRKFRK